MALEAKNKLGCWQTSNRFLFVPYWSCCNSMVLSWIFNSVSKDIASSVIFMKDAREVWLDLQNRFSQQNGPRIFEIQRSIVNHHRQNHSIGTNYTVLKRLWNEFANSNSLPTCTCGVIREINAHLWRYSEDCCPCSFASFSTADSTSLKV
ncbi:UBN2_3 domain-containing protein [Cephalotus follicularis]|uniref:UBN2_3 domain-containing protein n=1 Tax=Cephalotus follicularis TaxID=3775 RepID=A0A1Q3B4M2_CEPFO|nr:UBN2_3 domain-containing protein [Cephalotus follicularis]